MNFDELENLNEKGIYELYNNLIETSDFIGATYKCYANCECPAGNGNNSRYIPNFFIYDGQNSTGLKSLIHQCCGSGGCAYCDLHPTYRSKAAYGYVITCYT